LTSEQVESSDDEEATHSSALTFTLLQDQALKKTCSVQENKVGFECSKGDFGVNNVEIRWRDRESETVGFSLVKPGAVVEVPVVWFKDPAMSGNENVCWHGDKLSGKTVDHIFVAKCDVDGWATVNIRGGSQRETTFNQSIDEGLLPPLRCKEDDLPDFNPNKQCFWQLRIPCEC